MKNEFLETVGVSLQGLLGAFFGGIALLSKKTNQSWLATMAIFIGGVGLGSIVAPFFTDLLHLTNQRNADAVFGGIFGFGGYKFLNVIMDNYIITKIKNKGVE